MKKTKKYYTHFLKAPLAELISEANKIRQNYIGEKIDLCSIVNAKSGLCSEDCKFCAQSGKHNCCAEIYPLIDKDRILQAAKKAKRSGAGRFGIVTSGNRLSKKELSCIADAISAIRQKINIIACASLGALEKDDLVMLKKAGLSRYHHNIETSKNFYPKIVTTHTFKERLLTIKAAKDAGLEVCSGGIIGMGEAWCDRIEMAYTLKALGVDSVPINFLIPIKGTPLGKAKLISYADAIRTICIFRIILKDKTIKIAAGREAILKDAQEQGFASGANGMLVGGYLTIRGQGTEKDRELIKKIKAIWKKQ